MTGRPPASSPRIGRGGSSVWVDIQVLTSPKVSRQHVRIRRDGATFFVQDLSTWGTFVNDAQIPAAVAGPDREAHVVADGQARLVERFPDESSLRFFVGGESRPAGRVGPLDEPGPPVAPGLGAGC